MTSSERLDSLLTPRGAAVTLHATHNPAVERSVQRGEQLTPIVRIAGGFVEVAFDGDRWYAAESALETWTLATGAAAPQAGGAFFNRNALPPTQAAAPQPPYPPAQPAYLSPQQQPAYQQPASQQPYAPPNYPPQPQYYAAPVGGVGRPCAHCGRDFGPNRSCQYCRSMVGLPAGVSIASPGKRLGGYIVEILLAVFTIGIGWLVWSLVVYGKGQTPAKQLLGMRVVDVRTGRAASWGTMFLREFIVKFVLSIAISALTFGFGGIVVLVADTWLLWDKDNQELWDRMLNTVVVDDPQKLLDPRNG